MPEQSRPQSRRHPRRSIGHGSNYATFEILEPRALFSGNGLAAVYYASPDFTARDFARNDKQISFNGSQSPLHDASDQSYAVRWQGRVQADFSEQYRFITMTSGGVRLWVNNTLIIDNASNHALRTDSGYINLTAGKRYDIRMEYTSSGDNTSAAKLYWESAHVAKATVPQGRLYSAAAESVGPSTPTGLKGLYATDTALKFQWAPSTDASGPVLYDVYIGKTKVTTTSDTSYQRGGRSANTDYNLTVKAVDAFGNIASSKILTMRTAKTVKAGGGAGVAASYYSGSDFNQFEATRTDSSLNFNWSSDPIVSDDGTYSVRWKGQILPKYSETYTFYLTSDSGARLWINDKLVIDDWGDHSAREKRTNVTFAGGVKFNIRLDYRQTDPNADGVAKLEWSSLSQTRQLVPGAQLFPAFVDSAAPSAPSSLATVATTTTTADLEWNASTDDVAVARYEVYRDGALVGTASQTSFHDVNLSSGTSYSYKVLAVDGAGHKSNFSGTVGASTAASQVVRDSLSLMSAGSYDDSSGVSRSGGNVTSFDSNDWIALDNVDFHGGVNSVRITLAGPTPYNSGSFELRLDSASGAVIGTLKVQPTGSFSTYLTQQVAVSGASGVHDLFIVGRGASSIANVQAVQFSTRSLTRVMALGDSITQEFKSTPSWRYYLWQNLQNAGKGVDFVGTVHNATDGYSANLDYDQDHEGRSGIRADEVLANIANWASTDRPDVVLIHLGTNDLRQGQSASSTANDIASIIDVLRSVNPNVKIILAQIIPANDAPTGAIDQFNALLPNLVSSKNSSASPITLVDMNTNFSLATDTFDGLHPSDAGEQKMASRFFAALSPIV